MNNDIMRTVCLLSTSRSKWNVRDCFRLATSWFSENGQTPSLLSVHEQSKLGKLGKYPRQASRLAKLSEAASRGFTLIATEPEGDQKPNTQFRLYVAVMDNPRFFILSASPTYKMDIAALVAHAHSAFPVTYGYAFEAARCEGPVFTSIGLGYDTIEGSPDLYPIDLAGHWGHIVRLHWKSPQIETVLRSVYPLQVITPTHLRLPIAGMTLGAWIRADASRGKLEDIAPGLFLWRIALESQVRMVRAALYEAGLLWAWWPKDAEEPDIERALPKAK